MESSKEITVELIQRILRKAEKDSTITVLPSIVVNVLNEDLHGGSCLSRVIVKYIRSGDQSHHTLSLIFKVILELPSMAEAVNMMFPREIHMFDEILPRISTILNNASPDSHTDFFARIYYTQTSPGYLIAIEDLSPKGFKSPERKNGLDLKHCQLAIKMLAKFHAASVMIHNEEKNMFSIFNEYAFRAEAINKPLMGMGLKCFSIVARAVEAWPEFGPSWADRLRKRGKTLQQDLSTVWERDDSAFNVLVHGDLGLHNMMFRYSESGEPEAVMFVDFQCCSYNSPALDLQQFLFSSGNDEVKANHVDALLLEYHSELTTTLKLLGAPAGLSISLTQLRQEFESGLTPEDLHKMSDDDDLEKYEWLASGLFAKSLKKLLPFFSQKKLI